MIRPSELESLLALISNDSHWVIDSLVGGPFRVDMTAEEKQQWIMNNPNDCLRMLKRLRGVGDRAIDNFLDRYGCVIKTRIERI